MFRLLLIVTTVGFSHAVRFEIKNNEIGPIWVGIQGNAGKGALEDGGFELGAGQTRSVNAPDDWAGRFWPRTWCDSNSKHCLTGDCRNRLQCGGNGGAPPASLAEITLKGWGGIDYYDISLVDGFNIGVTFEPIGGQGDGGQYSCKKAQCLHNFQRDCPGELQQNSEHGVLGCKSACLAFNTDQYCCRGAHSTPDTCRSSGWPTDYPRYFKDHCPDAYSYAYDDHKSTFTCRADAYRIEFGGAR